ncbi:MAG: hypothetical protein JO033_07095 [Acidobacteriaceae bacterium]|nr:hypothetical protein [Acidobacteriaceae bacterium]MBV9482545.1 hypothetical protein [Acidobacteriota bacterium]
MLSELLDFREANTEFASLGPDGKPKSLWQENRSAAMTEWLPKERALKPVQQRFFVTVSAR